MSTTKKTALITGGSSGIGFAIAEKFAANGIHLILISRSQAGLEAAQQKLAQFPVSVALIALDISRPETMPEVVYQVLSRTDRLDILVNNAGGG